MPEPTGDTVAPATSRSRAAAFQDWLTRQAETSIGRLAAAWVRAYFKASRNSACAITLYGALSVVPTALAGVAYFHHSRSDANALATRIVAHLRLHGSTAELVQTTFASASANAAAATVAAVIGFLLWGIGIGQVYRDVYARAWGLELRSVKTSQLRFTVFFFVFAGALGLMIASASALRASGWIVLVTVWTVGSMVFWLWTPSYLLYRAVDVRSLLPGAIAATVVIGGTVATAPLYLSAAVVKQAAAFGSFGVALTLVGYLFVVITMSTVCAVFAPVWAAWRAAEGPLASSRRERVDG